MHAEKNMNKVYLYTRFERFWHWAQAALMVVLLVTGFEIHGTYSWLGFEQAVKVHEFCGVTWLILYVFIIFWLLTTGEWKHYIPTTRKLFEVMAYYAWGIFQGKPHPVKKRKDAKHNPLQRLTYMALSSILLPVQMMTGFLYWMYNSWAAWGLDWLSLEAVALIHTACGFAVLVFLLVHVYMTTTGHKVTAHVAAMITGWEEVEEDTPIEDWEAAKNHH